MCQLEKYLEIIDDVLEKGPYKPTWESLSAYEPPKWYRNAKFGIFIHWGIYSVPAFSSEWYSRNMYIQGSPEYEHHIKTYGEHMNFGYKDGVIYLHSAQDGRSISILERNPKVCITFSIDHALVFQHPEVACSYRMRSKSVIAWGKVAYEEDFDKKVEALDIIMKQYSDKTFRYSDPAVRNVKIWTVDIDEVSCKEFGAPHKKSY